MEPTTSARSPPPRRVFRAAAMATDVVRPEARSCPMASRIMVCSTFLTTEWSKASPAMSSAGSRTAVETHLLLPMVRGGRKARSISAGNPMVAVRMRAASQSL